jgi:hypothetical protein
MTLHSQVVIITPKIQTGSDPSPLCALAYRRELMAALNSLTIAQVTHLT